MKRYTSIKAWDCLKDFNAVSPGYCHLRYLKSKVHFFLFYLLPFFTRASNFSSVGSHSFALREALSLSRVLCSVPSQLSWSTIAAPIQVFVLTVTYHGLADYFWRQIRNLSTERNASEEAAVPCIILRSAKTTEIRDGSQLSRRLTPLKRNFVAERNSVAYDNHSVACEHCRRKLSL